MAIEHIRGVLKTFVRDFRDQLAKDAPETVRQAASDSLRDWRRQYGPQLPEDALAGLYHCVVDVGTQIYEAASGLAAAP